MSRTFIQVLVPPAVESPRGAEWAANVAIAIARVVSHRPAVEASATRTPGHAARSSSHPNVRLRPNKPMHGTCSRGPAEHQPGQ